MASEVSILELDFEPHFNSSFKKLGFDVKTATFLEFMIFDTRSPSGHSYDGIKKNPILSQSYLYFRFIWGMSVLSLPNIIFNS